LQYAYERGLVHRDIKPGNLLVQRSGERGWVVKILDFGLARLHGSATPAPSSPGDSQSADNQVMGTPDFIAPEQAKNPRQTDIRSDIYSLGCTMYFLLAGQVPFPGGNVLEKVMRHAKELPPPLHELRADIPETLSDIVMRMIAKLPDHRFQIPAEVVEALMPFCQLATGTLPGMQQVSAPINADASPWAFLFDEAETTESFEPTTGDLLVHPPSRKIASRSKRSAARRWAWLNNWWFWAALGAMIAFGALFVLFLILLFR
jgi:serine/threonine protein kinase